MQIFNIFFLIDFHICNFSCKQSYPTTFILRILNANNNTDYIIEKKVITNLQKKK